MFRPDRDLRSKIDGVMPRMEGFSGPLGSGTRINADVAVRWNPRTPFDLVVDTAAAGYDFGMTPQFHSTYLLRGWSVVGGGHGLPAIIAIVFVLHGAVANRVVAQTYPSGFTATTLVSTDLPRPISLAIAPDGRVFVGLQGGQIRIWKDGVGLLPDPYYNFPTAASGERGLFAIDINPDPTALNYLFAFYVQMPSNQGRVVSIQTANPADDVAIPNSETLLISPYTSTGNHNGGGLQFGVDGRLYISAGDRGISSNAQLLTNLRGKVLRINADGTIPEDNPTSFDGIAGTTTGENRAIYAVGFRNPFHLAIQPDTGRIFVNDVDPTQQVNECLPGRNYGWPSTQGPNTQPFVEFPYGSGANAGRAIVGGVFYSPAVCTLPPEYYNSYFCADYYSAWIKNVRLADRLVTSFATAIGGVTDMAIDSQGRMYLVSNNLGRLIRLDYTDPLPPAVARQPRPVRLCAGETAHFSFVPSGTLPLIYQWRHDNVALIDNARVSGANTPALTINDVTVTDVGSYTCFITNAHGDVLTGADLSLGMTGGSRTGNEIGRFTTLLQAGAPNAIDLCHFDFDGDDAIDLDDVPGLINRLLE